MKRLPFALLAASLSLLAVAARGDDASSKSGRALYDQRCALCHGATGDGEGVGAIGLLPKPRALRDAAWQASVSDVDLTKAIVGGGPAVGKSPLMPASPDLSKQPDALPALVRYVRSLKARSEPAAPAKPIPPPESK